MAVVLKWGSGPFANFISGGFQKAGATILESGIGCHYRKMGNSGISDVTSAHDIIFRLMTSLSKGFLTRRWSQDEMLEKHCLMASTHNGNFTHLF